METIDCRVRATIDLDRIAGNYRMLADRAGVAVIPVLKADAYGHGARRVGEALQHAGARLFAVASAEEAAELTAVLPDAAVLILGPTPPGQFPLLLTGTLVQTVHEVAYAEALAAFARRAGRVLPVHLKTDCGMGRLGLPLGLPRSVRDALDIAALPGLKPTGLFSHLPAPECPEATQKSIQLFTSFRNALSDAGCRIPCTHLCATGGLLCCGGCGCTHVRPGLGLYGYTPAGARDPGLIPALTLHARVAQCRTVRRGETVGYGACRTVDEDGFLITLAVGYADGLPRCAEGYRFFHDGVPLTLLAPVCMDFCMAYSPRPCPAGCAVELFGGTPGQLNSLAAHTHTIPYELLTRLSGRVRRVYL